MHRTDADSHVGNMFDEGDPGVPRAPTQIGSAWLNDVQETLAQAIEGSGITLVKGTYDQLKKAIGLGGGSGGARAFTASLVGEFWNIINTGAGIAMNITGNGTTLAAAVLTLLNNSTGPVAYGEGNSGGPLAKLKNFGNGVCLELEAKDGKSPLNLTPLTTLPASGMQAGDIVFLAGAYNKLYCYDGSAWNACW